MSSTKSHRSWAPIAFLISTTLLAGCNSTGSGSAKDANRPTVSELVAAVQSAISSADSTKGWLPKLSKVKLQIQTVKGKKSTGGIDILFVSLKGYDEQVETQELDVVLVPRELHIETIDSPAVADLKKKLAEAIAIARKSVNESYPATMTGSPTLDTKQVDIQLGFSLTTGGSGGIKWDLSPITLSGGVDKSNKAVQTITLTFGQ